MTDGPAEVIAVLGAPNDVHGRLSGIAVARCTRAVELYRERPRPIVPTGGLGAHFNRTGLPHYSYLRRHLLASGVPEAHVMEGLASGNTIEDVQLLIRFATQAAARLVVVTSDFHVLRVELLLRRLGPAIGATVISAPTPVGHEQLELLKEHERQAIRALA